LSEKKGQSMKTLLSLFISILFCTAGIAWADTAEEWHEKGIEAKEIGYYSVAIRCFEKAVELNPNDAKSHYNIGLLYSKKGKTKEAISHYKQAIAINPSDADFHYNLGHTYFGKKMFKESISEYKEVITIAPDHADAHRNLGYSYLKKGMDPAAADHFYKAGVLSSRQNDREGALKAYEGLKQTNSKELKKTLFDKLYPGRKGKEGELSK
jgi:tetratricopeptide (TPR) repeat protein